MKTKCDSSYAGKCLAFFMPDVTVILFRIMPVISGIWKLFFQENRKYNFQIPEKAESHYNPIMRLLDYINLLQFLSVIIIIVVPQPHLQIYSITIIAF